MSEASADGAAYDASVDTETPIILDPRGLPFDPLAEAEAVVAAAQTKVERQREHLAGAEQALAEAEAALCALQDQGE